jgi:hypothetical protein
MRNLPSALRFVHVQTVGGDEARGAQDGADEIPARRQLRAGVSFDPYCDRVAHAGVSSRAEGGPGGEGTHSLGLDAPPLALAVGERIRFLRELADRFRGGDQTESALMAAFLAGPAREQATQNARILAKDILAEGAAGYFALPEKDRAKYIDNWVANWTRTGERIATGKESRKTDDERLADIRGQAERGRERQSERPADQMPSLTEDGAMRFLDFWASDVEKAASPVEQGQIVRFLGDVRKRFGG